MVQASEEERRAIAAALAPDTVVDLARQCHVASRRLVEAAETRGTALSRLWRDARVVRGTCKGVPDAHSWVVVDGARIVDVTRWSYDPSVEPVLVTGVDDPDYRPG